MPIIVPAKKWQLWYLSHYEVCAYLEARFRTCRGVIYLFIIVNVPYETRAILKLKMYMQKAWGPLCWTNVLTLWPVIGRAGTWNK